MNCIVYRSGYKYQLKASYSQNIPIQPASPIVTEYIELDSTGQLTLHKGYAWDGPSGPTIDTVAFMRGSLVHDGLYQLMRERHLDHKIHRKTADLLLRQICQEDGMWWVVSWLVYVGVRLFADPATDPAADRPLVHAPRNCQTSQV